jgi:hypothetical protein
MLHHVKGHGRREDGDGVGIPGESGPIPLARSA